VPDQNVFRYSLGRLGNAEALKDEPDALGMRIAPHSESELAETEDRLIDRSHECCAAAHPCAPGRMVMD